LMFSFSPILVQPDEEGGEVEEKEEGEEKK
jgi:hypothetical protein